jgi:hypothetical protein
MDAAYALTCQSLQLCPLVAGPCRISMENTTKATKQMLQMLNNDPKCNCATNDSTKGLALSVVQLPQVPCRVDLQTTCL